MGRRFFHGDALVTIIVSWFLCSAAGISQPLKAADDIAIGPGDIRADAITSREALVSRLKALDSHTLRDQLMKQARQKEGGSRLAHWYAGEIQDGNRWMSIDKTRQIATEDVQLSQYYKLRNSARDTPQDHERLAKWCQKNALQEIADMHWLHVLRFSPQHRGALNALDLRWHNGFLMSHNEFEWAQEQEQWLARQQKKWKPTASRLRREIEKNNPDKRLEARKELRQIRDPAAVPALVAEFTEKAPSEEVAASLESELVETLGNIPSPEAVETIVRFAVNSPRESVRYIAIDQLKERNYEEYVPALLAAMSMPIEGSVSVHEIGNRIVTDYSYSQEGPAGRQVETSRQSYRNVPGQRYRAANVFKYRSTTPAVRVPERTVLRDRYPGHSSRVVGGGCGSPPRLVYRRDLMIEETIPGYTIPTRDNYERIGTVIGDEDPNYTARKNRVATASQADAQREDQALRQRNQAITAQNERIGQVLVEVTGEKLKAFPKSWWNWWSNYLDQHPDLAASGARQQFNAALLNQHLRGLARGTLVWTHQGKQAVETVRPGDYVLSQAPQTGELAYKLVLAIGNPREIPVSKIHMGETSLHSAPGHVIWATGLGWQRVSKLTQGQPLHGLHQEPTVGQVEDAFTIDSYDLVIDDFHTLFVGQHGLLVHDATPIQPAYVALPGFSAGAVSSAVRLAAIGPNSQ